MDSKISFYERAMKHFNIAISLKAEKEFDLALESLGKALRRVDKALLENPNDGKAETLKDLIETETALVKTAKRKQDEARKSAGV